MGIRLSDTADFVMEDVFVPAECLIGREGYGFAQTMKFLAGKRPVSVAGAVGVAQRALDLAVDYARERSFKHGPIAKLEGIQILKAAMEMRTPSTARMLNSMSFSSCSRRCRCDFRQCSPWQSTARR